MIYCLFVFKIQTSLGNCIVVGTLFEISFYMVLTTELIGLGTNTD